MKLADIVNNNTTDKNTVHSYLESYENLFAKKRLENVKVLEIGVMQGGSIKLWRDYFINGQIYGVDVTDIHIQETSILSDERIKLYIGVNAYDINFLNLLQSEQFDILIDDGPHSYESMEFFVKHYLPLLKEDGILVIEDIQHWSWIDELKKHIPDTYNIRVFDLRTNKGRYDDILFVIQKEHQ